MSRERDDLALLLLCILFGSGGAPRSRRRPDPWTPPVDPEDNLGTIPLPPNPLDPNNRR